MIDYLYFRVKTREQNTENKRMAHLNNFLGGFSWNVFADDSAIHQNSTVDTSHTNFFSFASSFVLTRLSQYFCNSHMLRVNYVFMTWKVMEKASKHLV